MTMAVLYCGGDSFSSPAGGGMGTTISAVPGAAVFPVSADNGPFVCTERVFLLSGEDSFWKGARI